MIVKRLKVCKYKCLKPSLKPLPAVVLGAMKLTKSLVVVFRKKFYVSKLYFFIKKILSFIPFFFKKIIKNNIVFVNI